MISIYLYIVYIYTFTAVYDVATYVWYIYYVVDIWFEHDLA